LIDLSNTDAVSDASITIIARNCSLLEDINISSTTSPVPITDAAIYALCEHCSNITRLGLSNCTRIRDASLFYISQMLSSLEVIDVSRCLLLSGAGWTQLVTTCRHLTTIDISHTRIPIATSLDATSRYTRSLKEVIMHRNDILNDDGLMHLARASQKLQKIDVSHCSDGVTDDGLSSLAMHCPELQHVNTALCASITSAGWIAIAQACVHLQLVTCDLCNVEDTMLAALGATCHQLESLSMRGCDGISSSGVQQLARGCPLLTDVDFAGCMITDQGVGALAAACPHLQSLNLSYNLITDAGLLAVAKYCRQLLALYLCEVHEITDAGISAIAATNPHIHTLDATHCNITNASLTVLSKYCHELYVVTVDDCSGISDRGIIALSCGNPNLQTLCIDNCNGVTDTAVEALVDNCNILHELHVHHCRKISWSTLAKAQSEGLHIYK